MQVKQRHLLLKSTIDTLTMEDEAYEKSFFLAWVFFPTFFVIGVLQLILFNLYNQIFHPFGVILKGADNNSKN